jgi:hypothetical protein
MTTPAESEYPEGYWDFLGDDPPAPPTITLTVWHGLAGKTREEIAVPWAELPNFIRRRGGHHREKRSCPLLKFAEFGDLRTESDSLRHDGNVLRISGIEGDYDGEEISPSEAIARLEKHQIRGLVTTTYRHSDDRPRWRVLAPLSRPVPPEERLRFAEVLNGVLNGILAPESAVLSQSYYIGWAPGVEPQVLATFDDPAAGLCLDEIPQAEDIRRSFARVKSEPADNTERGTQQGYLKTLLAGGQIHDNALKIVAKMVADGVAPPVIHAVFAVLAERVAELRGEERAADLRGAELERMIDGAVAKFGHASALNDFHDTLRQPFGGDQCDATQSRWLVPAGELLVPPEPLEYLLQDRLLPGCLAMLFGDPEAGKSLLALAWSVSVATGEPWLGHRVKQGPVIYIAGEGHHGIRRRLLALGIDQGLGAALKTAPLFVSAAGTSFVDTKALGAMVAEIDAVAVIDGPPVMIVVDTLHRNLGGEENSETDIGHFLRAADTLRLRYGATILVVHHSGHGDKSRVRGSSSLRGGVDLEYALVNNQGTRTLKATKTKDIAPPKLLSFGIKTVALPWRDAAGTPEVSVVLESHQHTPTPRKGASEGTKLAFMSLLAALADSPPAPADWSPLGGRPDRSAPLDTWRAAFLDRHSGDSLDTKSKAFRRAKGELETAKAVEIWRDRAWPSAEVALGAVWPELESIWKAWTPEISGLED